MQSGDMAPTERLKLRRQMAGAAGRKETASPSLFMEAFARRALYHAHSDLGTRSLGREVVYRTERSMDEADL